jgi:hypothetical protein
MPLRIENFSAFRTGARYKAIDASKPKFAGVYTVSDSSVFTDPAYTALRANRSPRETDLIKRLAVLDRRVINHYLMAPEFGVRLTIALPEFSRYTP